MARSLDFVVHGNFVKVTEGIEQALAGAITTVVRRKTTLLANAVKRQVASSLSERLSHTVKSQSFPASPRTSIGAKGIVYSKAIYKRPGGLMDLLAFFDASANPLVSDVITGLHGKFLALALPPAGRGRGQKRFPTPRDFPPGTFRFMPSLHKPGTGFLVFKKPPRERAFYLIPLVKIGKRLDLKLEADRVLFNLEDNIETELDRRLQRLAETVR